MKAKHKAGTALPAPVLRGIVMHAQPHALARPARSSLQPPAAKVHALPPSTRGDAGGSADRRASYEQAFADGRKEGYAAGRSDAQADNEAQLQLAIDAARASAVDEGRAQGLKEGRELADAELAQAKKVALEEAGAERRLQAERVERLLSGIERQAAKALWDAEDDLVALAHDAICRVLGDEASAPGTIGAIVRHLLGQHGQRTRLSVHVHPDDMAALQDDARAGDEWRWVADRSVQLGGVILRSPEGSLDARLETQLAALKEALLATRAQRCADHADGKTIASPSPGEAS